MQNQLHELAEHIQMFMVMVRIWTVVLSGLMNSFEWHRCQNYAGPGRALSTVIASHTIGGSRTMLLFNTMVVAWQIAAAPLILPTLNYRYRISSKNSAPLIIRHPFAELGQKTSIFGKEIPKYFQI